MAGKGAVSGLRGLDRALRQIPKSTGTAITKRAALTALGPFVERVKELAPVGSGDLRDSYHAGTKLNPTQAAMVRRTGKSAVEVYAGTNNPAGVQTEFGNVHQAAEPHVRPAWDGTKDTIPEALAAALWDQISRAVK